MTFTETLIMRAYYLPVFILVLIPMLVLTQTDSVSGGVGTTVGARITILGVFPDSFPNVSVVFRAETENGEPVLNLSTNNVFVSENGQSCELLSVEQVGVNQPVLMSLVVDHSGSMILDYSQFFNEKGEPLTVLPDTFRVFLYGWDSIYWPAGYIPPIENARTAIKDFVSGFNSDKDRIGMVGFSTQPDLIVPLTNNKSDLMNATNSIQADGSTALYASMMEGLNLLDQQEGIPVMIVMTDGFDNMSAIHPSAVIARAREMEVPIYIIGLGSVNKDTLQIIADSTRGEAFFIRSATALPEIYAKISRKVQSFYNLVYRSPNMEAADSNRSVIINFSMPGVQITNNAAYEMALPHAIQVYLKEKEQERTYYLYGGIGVAAVVGASSLLFLYKRRKKNDNDVFKIYPNPSDGHFTLEQPFGAGVLALMNTSGAMVAEKKITALLSEQDFSNLESGTYIAQVTATDGRQLTKQIIIQK